MPRIAPVLRCLGSAVLLVGVAACGNNNNDGTSTTTTTPSPTTPTPTTTTNTAPTFTSAATATVAEGSTATGYTASATDADGDALTFSTSGGADQASFSIDATTGVLSFVAAPDYGAPADADANNVYEVQLRVSDGTDADTLDLAVTVTNVNSAPVFTSSGSVTATDGGTSSGYTATASDADGDPLTFSIVGGADASLFAIDSSTGVLSFVSAPDFTMPGDADANNDYEVQLQVSDGEATALLDVTVTVVEAGTLSIEVTFPTPNANLGGIDTTIVTGNVVDSGGAPIDPAAIDFIEVGAAVATLDAAVPGRWSASVAVVAGDNVLPIAFHRADGVVLQSELRVQNQQMFQGLNDIEIDTSGAATNRAVMVSTFSNGLLGVDLTRGAVAVISDSTAGSGPNFDSPRDVAIDTTRGRALVVDWRLDALFAVDLATGDRSEISGPSVGAGVALDGPISVAFDAANDRALVVVSSTTDLLAVDLATGDRSVFSGTGVGSGQAFSDPQDIEVDNVSAAASRRAYVSDTTLDAIIAIDLATGDRTVLSDSSVGTGPAVSPESMTLDVANDRIIAANLVGQVILVDMSTGDRTLLRDLGEDYGRNSTRPRGIALDSAASRVLIADAQNSAVLSVDLKSGDKSVVADNSVGAGTDRLILWDIDGISLDRARNRLVATAGAVDALIAVDLGSGDRSVVSSDGTIVPAVGTGPTISSPQRVTVDATGSDQAFLIASSSAVFSVDLVSGDRFVVSDNVSLGTGEGFVTPVDLAVDVPNERLLVADRSKGVLSVGILSGNRYIVSSTTVGAGSALTDPTSLVLAGASVAYSLDWQEDALLSIDLFTGNRAPLSDNAGAGSGPSFSLPVDMSLDLDNGRFIVIDRGFPASLLEVSYEYGVRTVISGSSVGTGIPFGSPYHVDIDVPGDRAFVYDVGRSGIIVVDLATGQRALMSK